MRPLWRLAPWWRAPLLGLRAPAAVVAVLLTTAVLSCAIASAPLFLSSARSAAVQQQLAQRCAEVGWAQTGVAGPLDSTDGSAPAIDSALLRAWRSAGYEPLPVLSTAQIGTGYSESSRVPLVAASGVPLSEPVTLFYRPGAVDQIDVRAGGGQDGVYLPAELATADGVQVGQQLTVGTAEVAVAGIYTDFADEPPRDAWCDYRSISTYQPTDQSRPQPFVVVSDESTFYRLAAAYGWATRLQQVPVDPAGLSATAVRRLLRDQAAVQALLPTRADDPAAPVAAPNSRLPDVLDRAGTLESGLRGPVVPVAVSGGVLAQVLVAAAGSAWADKRAAEVRLLAARGVGPAPLAGKAALELALPALAGAVVGWGAARLLVAAAGPASAVDPSATARAGYLAAAGFLVGLATASTVAGLRARGTAERPLGAGPRWPATVPWELAAVLAAAGCWALLRSRDAIVSEAGIAQVNGLLVAFPVLAVAGVAVLTARLITGLLPRLRRWSAGRSPAVFLAVNRLAAARAATAVLLVAVTLPVAVLGYTAVLTASSQRTLEAKVGVQIGAGQAVTSITRLQPTPAMSAAGTFLVRYDGSVAQGGTSTDVQVLAIDPATFADTAAWDRSFADEPLDRLVDALETPDVDGRLPMVAAGLPAGATELRVGRLPVPVQVVGTARVLPGRRTDAPLLLVAADRLGEVPRSAVASPVSELWSGSAGPAAAQAMADAGARNLRTLDPAGVYDRANFLGITWTFGYLSALAVFVGVIAVGGLLLHLEARSRTRVSGYVMARRLGLTRAAHLRSLLVELVVVSATGVLLGGLLAAGAVAVVYRRLDVDLLRPPTELLDVPWPTVAVTVLGALAAAVLAAVYAQSAADRADPATVLREDA